MTETYEERGEAVLASLTLVLKRTSGQLCVDLHSQQPEELRDVLDEWREDYTNTGEIVNVTRWVGEYLSGIRDEILANFIEEEESNDSMDIQEWDVRSEGEVGRDKEVQQVLGCGLFLEDDVPRDVPIRT